MLLVAIRMPKAGLVMANDRIVPVRNVKGSLGSKTNVDRAERDVVARDERRLLHGFFATRKFLVRHQLMAIDRVLKKAARDEFSLHRLGPMGMAGHVDATKLAQAIGLDDLTAVRQLLATQQKVRDAMNLPILALR